MVARLKVTRQTIMLPEIDTSKYFSKQSALRHQSLTRGMIDVVPMLRNQATEAQGFS